MEATRVSDLLKDSILSWKPDHRISTLVWDTCPARSAWALDIDRLNRLDKVSWERIERVVRWLPDSGFWTKNIQSGATLRKQFDRLEAEMDNPRGKVVPKEFRMGEKPTLDGNDW